MATMTAMFALPASFAAVGGELYGCGVACIPSGGFASWPRPLAC